MDPSKVNIYPERRKPKGKASEKETSHYFEPSKLKRTRSERGDDDGEKTKEDGRGNQNTSRLPPPNTLRRSTRKRQTTLSFTRDNLSTKSTDSLRNPTPRTDAARLSLSDIARQTLKALPLLLAHRPDVPIVSFLCQKSHVEPLDQSFNPHLPQVRIVVLNSDTLDAALALPVSSKPPLILNMANATVAGGGFLHGAVAQEEAICFRTSLYMTLIKRRHYPLPDRAAIYSPTVLVIRDSAITGGHALLDPGRNSKNLPVVSVVSAAAVCMPALLPDTKIPKSIATNTATNRQGGTAIIPPSLYVSYADKLLMQAKMRIILRTAARNKHRQIVLGAFGCGVFANPPREVAEMWLDILRETEFEGWWEDVVFAVYDPSPPGGEPSGGVDAAAAAGGNYAIFKTVLDGQLV